MCSDLFFHKLAIERCQYHLAQLCAATWVGLCHDEQKTVQERTILLLLENLSRDLFVLRAMVEQQEGDPCGEI